MRPFAPYLDGFQDVSDQLDRHIRLRAHAAAARLADAKAAIRTREAFLAHRQRMRGRLLDAIGGLPGAAAEPTAVVAGRVEAEAFTIEKLLLDTLPGARATANLYVPHPGGPARSEPLPGVLFLHGHSLAAKAQPLYQRVCRSLARAGMVVLALDPVGQGERRQYVEPGSGRPLIAGSTEEHSYAGFQCHVAGFGIARYFIADAMAALTYLAARPEVDPRRLGVTGCSGGGTQTAYLICLDDRLACAAPCAYITSRTAYMATGQAHDSEQNLAGALVEGPDHEDLLGGLVPKPLLIGATASDFFCIEGTLSTFQSLQRTYALFDRVQDLYMVVSPGPHGYPDTLRERVTAFFRRHLLGEPVDLASGLTSHAGLDESPLPPGGSLDIAPEDHVDPEVLQVTRTGQIVLDDPTAATIFDLNLAAWRGRAPDPAPAARLAAAVLADRRRPPLWVRETARGGDQGIAWSHRYTFAEPDIALPMIELRRDDGDPAAPIVVAALPHGTEAVADSPGVVRELLSREAPRRVLLFDTRGTGAGAQRRVNARGPEAVYGTDYKLNYDAMMLGDSLFAMRTFDALRVLEYAHRIASEVEVYGEGTAGIILLAAAVLDGRVVRGRFARMLRSFRDLIESRSYLADHALEAHGLALLPDIPELLATLPAAELTDPLDALGRPVA